MQTKLTSAPVLQWFITVCIICREAPLDRWYLHVNFAQTETFVVVAVNGSSYWKYIVESRIKQDGERSANFAKENNKKCTGLWSTYSKMCVWVNRASSLLEGSVWTERP